MGGGSGGGSSGAGWTLILLPAVDGEVLAEYWTDTNATPVEITAGQSAKISASKIYLSIMCDGEPVSALDIPVLFDGSTAKYDTQNEGYTLSASSGTHTVQVGTVTLTISPGTVGSMRPGDTATFKATVSPANLSVIWSVDGPGNLAGNGLTATYTATQAGAVQVAAAVDMTNAGSSVSFTVSEPIVKIRRHRMRDDGTYEIEHHETGAEQVIFSDGETFQAKLDAGKLTGKDGKDGTPGKDGINGKSAYQQAVAAGYTGTEAAFYTALVSMKDAPFLPLAGGTVTDKISFDGGDLDGLNGYPLIVGMVSDIGDYDPCGLQRGAAAVKFADDGFIEIYGAQVEINTSVSVSGAIWLDTPIQPNHAANKAYVDSKSIQYGTCATSSATAAKVVTLSGFALSSGAMVLVKFTYANTNTTATLNVNGTGAKSIRVNGAAVKAGMIQAGMYALFEYDGTYWQLLNPVGIPMGGGTFTGPVYAQPNTSYTTYQARNIALVTTAPTSMTNGQIALVYT